MNKAGRPLKYKALLDELEPGTVYTPAMIARFANEHRALFSKSKKDTQKTYQQIRICMAIFARTHRFPKEGDGLVFLSGQAPTVGWLGSRWKRATQHAKDGKEVT